MNIDENVVESIVKRVVSQLSTETASAQTCPSGGDWGVFESMNDAVDAAVEAQREYLNRSMARPGLLCPGHPRRGAGPGESGVHLPPGRGGDWHGRL